MVATLNPLARLIFSALWAALAGGWWASQRIGIERDIDKLDPASALETVLKGALALMA